MNVRHPYIHFLSKIFFMIKMDLRLFLLWCIYNWPWVMHHKKSVLISQKQDVCDHAYFVSWPIYLNCHNTINVITHRPQFLLLHGFHHFYFFFFLEILLRSKVLGSVQFLLYLIYRNSKSTTWPQWVIFTFCILLLSY